jgi:hypothetical protein
MRSKFPVQTGASHAQEDAQVPASPAWVASAAVCAVVVAGHIADEFLQCSLMSCLLALVDCRSHRGVLNSTDVQVAYVAGRVEADKLMCL